MRLLSCMCLEDCRLRRFESVLNYASMYLGPAHGYFNLTILPCQNCPCATLVAYIGSLDSRSQCGEIMYSYPTHVKVEIYFRSDTAAWLQRGLLDFKAKHAKYQCHYAANCRIHSYSQGTSGCRYHPRCDGEHIPEKYDLGTIAALENELISGSVRWTERDNSN